MADTQTTDNATPRTTVSASKRLGGWLYPALRIAFLSLCRLAHLVHGRTLGPLDGGPI